MENSEKDDLLKNYEILEILTDEGAVLTLRVKFQDRIYMMRKLKIEKNQKIDQDECNFLKSLNH